MRGDGFGATLRAEWTKLRTVRRWVLTLLCSGILIVMIGLLVSSSSGSDANQYPNFVVGPDGQPVVDEFEFAHQTMSGDGTITARVDKLEDSGTDASAGLIVKDGLTSGSRYVALRVTPKDGVHLESDYMTDVRGGDRTAPIWLRLTRQGSVITGYESADGSSWTKVGHVTAAKLPRDVEVGMFVNSAPKVIIRRSAGSTAVGEEGTRSTATFDNVRLDTAATGPWEADSVQRPRTGPKETGDESGSAGPPLPGVKVAGVVERDGTFTITGGGQIKPNPPDDDVVSIALFGVLPGLMALAAVGVLFVTSEYRKDMIRTTFAANPRRGRTLAAKAIVIGSAAFVMTLLGGGVVLLAAQPVLQEHGFAPPAYPEYSLTDPPVLRALLLTSLFVAILTVFAMALGTVLRHSATAITTVVVLIVVPVILSSILPLSIGRWVMQLTPAGGLATWRAKPPTTTLADPWSMIGPAAGLTVVSVYAAVTLAIAWWLLRRRDA
ncbi:ABC transporter permease subunit [Dactylosporangium sp. AC04546]|uniref:ABC transporter permease subunit n=1 Tax=Dactylosporangium sp. AC04546 TaxID=2862460 RepID=UPI001EDEB395|nr:ABC transporter permease subunit [Dactylosporangium sp. AC04546]WVK86070.1 ABC transporter permease subunit [Dactylosporangium sp. AC04546]